MLSELETVLGWARSGYEWDKVYRFIFLHPEHFFTIPNGRNWPIAHQVVYHGDVDLLKRILVLFSDDQIDIRTLSNDKKTLLDVAKDRRIAYLPMYTYIEHLFLQDDLIQAAKQSNWDLVSNLLEKNPGLTNEKPPYSTYFLLHYVIENGDKEILQDLLQRFQFQTNILSADNETPIDMAKRLRKYDLCSILEQKTQDQSQTLTAPSTCPYPTNDPFPCLGFGNILIEISKDGSFIYSTDNPFTSIVTEQQQQTTQNVHTAETTVYQNSESTPITPITPASKAQALKNLICSLTREIFVDPVIASDGQTYEREAITEWLNSYHWSPTTGAPMDATFIDNTELKKMIQSMIELR
jgi:hypothetical protein